MKDGTRTLIEIAQTLDATSDAGLRLSRSLELVRAFIGGDRCSVLFERDEDGERDLLTVPPLSGDEADVFKEKLTRVLRAVEGEGQAAERTAGLDLALPLMGLDEVRGLLAIQRRRAPFAPEEMRLLSVIAAQLGAYLTMLRLHGKAVALDRFRQEMSAVVVHDLKNPMAAVVTTVDFLSRELEAAPESVRSSLADVRGGCNRIMRLIANLLDLTRLESDRLPLELAAIKVGWLLGALARQREAQARARNITIVLTDVDAVPPIRADEDLVARIVENLLDNALRYTPRNGRIEIGARALAETVEITVGNTGPPIPRDAVQRIFEKFGQASKGGRMNLGLGLYFARLAMEAMGGRISLDLERPALPTCFRLELPVAAASPAPA